MRLNTLVAKAKTGKPIEDNDLSSYCENEAERKRVFDILSRVGNRRDAVYLIAVLQFFDYGSRGLDVIHDELPLDKPRWFNGESFYNLQREKFRTRVRAGKGHDLMTLREELYNTFHSR
jgi:hypothetical protein